MLPRLERILYKLAYQHAPHLVPPGWSRTGDRITRIQTLARALASYDITVLVAEIPESLLSLKDLHIQDWLRNYAQMYNLLRESLFPSYGGINAQYADDRIPPVIVFKGAATPIITLFSGYITPYLTVRQDQTISDLEIRGLMDFILAELEAESLPRPQYKHLRETGAVILRQMLNSTVKHVSLTLFDKPVLDSIQPPSLRQVTEKHVAPPPTQLPEQKQLQFELEHLPSDEEPETPTEQMFVQDIPMNRPPGRRPPVPPLPSKRDGTS